MIEITKAVPGKATREAREYEFNIRKDGAMLRVKGWMTTHALGVLETPEGTFSSIMFMTGVALCDGFPTMLAADAFNRRMHKQKKFLVGHPDLEAVFNSIGGRMAAQKLVEQLKKPEGKELT